MYRTQRLQVNEAIHRHRLRDQSQRNEQDELYGLTPGKFADIKKDRIFAPTFGIKAERLIRKHKKGIQPPNTECLFFVI